LETALELTAQKAGNDMSNTVKKEEFGDIEGFDQHGEACRNDGCQNDYVEDTDDLEDDVTWTGQVFLEERHCCVMMDVESDFVGRVPGLGRTKMFDRGCDRCCSAEDYDVKVQS